MRLLIVCLTVGTIGWSSGIAFASAGAGGKVIIFVEGPDGAITYSKPFSNEADLEALQLGLLRSSLTLAAVGLVKQAVEVVRDPCGTGNLNLDGGVLNVAGGTTRLHARGGVTNIFGGEILRFTALAPSGGVLSNELHFFGTEFLLDGVPIEGLVYGEALEMTDRDVTLSGLLADGSPLIFELNSTSLGPEDHMSPDALLTVTLILPGAFIFQILSRPLIGCGRSTSNLNSVRFPLPFG